MNFKQFITMWLDLTTYKGKGSGAIIYFFFLTLGLGILFAFFYLFYIYSTNTCLLAEELSFNSYKFAGVQKILINETKNRINYDFDSNIIKVNNEEYNNDLYLLKKKLFYFINKRIYIDHNISIINKNSYVYLSFERKKLSYYILKSNFFYGSNLNLSSNLDNNLLIKEDNNLLIKEDNNLLIKEDNNLLIKYDNNLLIKYEPNQLYFKFKNGSCKIIRDADLKKIININNKFLINPVDIINVENLSSYYNNKDIVYKLQNRFLLYLYNINLANLGDDNINLIFFEKNLKKIGGEIPLSLLNNIEEKDIYSEEKKLVASISERFIELELKLRHFMFGIKKEDPSVQELIDLIFLNKKSIIEYKKLRLLEDETKNVNLSILFNRIDTLLVFSDFNHIYKNMRKYSF
jgi:hypothetical protein